jgi:hypothetical protein
MQGAGVLTTLPLLCTFCALPPNYTAFYFSVKRNWKIFTPAGLFLLFSYETAGKTCGGIFSLQEGDRADAGRGFPLIFSTLK